MDQIHFWIAEGNARGLDGKAYANNKICECIYALNGPLFKKADGSLETTGKISVSPDDLGNMHYLWEDNVIFAADSMAAFRKLAEGQVASVTCPQCKAQKHPEAKVCPECRPLVDEEEPRS